MLTVTYRNKQGTAKRVAVPEIEDVEPAKMLAGVVKNAIEDSGPIAYVRLVADAEAEAETAPEAPGTPPTTPPGSGDGKSSKP